MTCDKILSNFATCSYTDGNRTLTNILYFIFRMLATMCLACNFVLLHAQTIQMCKVEEDRGNTGALGKFVYILFIICIHFVYIFVLHWFRFCLDLFLFCLHLYILYAFFYIFIHFVYILLTFCLHFCITVFHHL